ncbi:ribonuclease E inhibitor RraB [Thalassotalea ganghwensis]
MERNYTLFPEDVIGDALWKMMLAGDDLSEVREIEFSVIFPSQELALQYGHLLLENNQKLSLCPFQGDDDFPWEITAYPEMAASYENIAAYQHLIEASAEPLKGKFDGWYCVTSSKLPY